MRTDTLILAAFTIASATGLQGSLDEILTPLPTLAEKKPVFVAPKPSEVKAAVQAENLESTPVETAAAKSDSEEVEVIPISEGDLLQAIEDSVHDHFRPATRVSLEPLRAMPKLSSYSQPFNVQLSRLPGRLSSNTMFLSVQVENEKGVIGKWDIPFRPRLYSEVWFTRTYLRKGELASAADLEPRKVDLLLEPNAIAADRDVLLKHEYSRDVRPGEPLEWNDLVERSLVRKGQVVDVVAYQGMIGITMRAKAQQDGVRGDVVFLRNIESAKEFTGTVIDEGRVEVTF